MQDKYRHPIKGQTDRLGRQIYELIGPMGRDPARSSEEALARHRSLVNDYVHRPHVLYAGMKQVA